jgi:hypothetical protein
VSIQSAYFDWLRAALTSASGALAGLSEVRLVPGTVDVAEAMTAQIRLAEAQAVVEQLLRDVHTPVEPPAPIDPPAPAPVPVDPPAPVPAPPPPPAEPPAPAPAPAEPPAPEPLPQYTEMQSMPVNLLDVGYLTEWKPAGSVYTRRQAVLTLAGSAARFTFEGGSGGNPRVLRSPQYVFQFDGVTVATVTTPPNAQKIDVVVDVSAMPRGWVEVKAIGTAGESLLPYWAWIESAVPSVGRGFVTVATASHDLSRMNSGAVYTWGRIYADYKPTPRPLPPRNPPPLVAPVPMNQLHVAALSVFRDGDPYRCVRTSAGALTALTAQDYFYSDLIRAEPVSPHLDGPRGVGAFSNATFMRWGRNGNLYAASAHRICRVAADGKITTLVGWRDDDIATHWQSKPRQGRLVGDWSAVPKDRRGFIEIWGFAWKPDSVTVDENAAPIINDITGVLEQPHGTGPVLFVADSQRDRIIACTFPTKHHDEPVVAEFITGLQDPWNVVCVGNELIVSERKSHRIAAYDATTGAFLRVVVQGQPLAWVSAGREVHRTVSLAQCRAVDCVAPEGLDYHDGWLYFTSVAQADIRKVRLDGSGLNVFHQFNPDGNTLYSLVSVSDGSCLPAGTVCSARWSSVDGGLPRIILPDGTTWGIGALTDPLQGAGFGGGFTYLSAACIGSGGIAAGGVNEGILVITRRITGEPLISAAAVRGKTKWRNSGRILQHGEGGFGMYDLPLPWGEDPDIDAYLIQNGHTQGT